MKMYGILQKKPTIRDNITWHWYPCPGCQLHGVSPQQRKLLFSRYVDLPQQAWLVYWRSHPVEYNAMLTNVNRPTLKLT